MTIWLACKEISKWESMAKTTFHMGLVWRLAMNSPPKEMECLPLLPVVRFEELKACWDVARLWNWLGEYVLDDEELRPSKERNQAMNASGFVFCLKRVR